MRPVVLLALLALLALLVLVPVAALAQGPGPATGSLRPYWHVFVAYAAAWLLVLGWVAHIGRRLSRVESHLGE